MARLPMVKEKRNFFKCFCIIICGIILTSFASCAKEEKVKANIWTASGTEKIMPSIDYSSRYADNKILSIRAFRNEYESAQIIITPDKDTSYTVKPDVLTSSEGNTLPVEAFTLYHEKYIYMAQKKDLLCEYEAGYIPDALLPYDKAVEYKENTIKADENQGIWVTVKPSKEQAAGLYSGNFSISLDGAEYNVPVQVYVYDYTLSDETHIKTSFALNWTEIEVAELDSTLEDEYDEFLLNHRITSSVPYYMKHENDFKQYFEYVKKNTLDPRCSSFEILFGSYVNKPVQVNESGLLAMDEDYGKEGNNYVTLKLFNFDYHEKLMSSFIEKSIEYGLNLFKKASLRSPAFDEFDLGDGYSGLNKALYCLRRSDDFVKHLADIIYSLEWTENGVKQIKTFQFNEDYDNGGIGYEIVEKGSPVFYECPLNQEEFDALKEEMQISVLKIKNVTTTVDYALSEIYYNYTDSNYCPRITVFQIEEQRKGLEAYAKKGNSEIWTYTCGLPATPYPTYHIDDYLLSSRLLGWMMYDYEIIGNLYWETALYRYTSRLELSSQLKPQDQYAETYRCPPSNGDGFLVYPGRVYGIKGPVGSIRLDSIRDGNEDYDLFYALEGFYKERGLSAEDFETILPFIVNGLYNGAECNYSKGYLDNFASCRERLAGLLEMAFNSGVIIERCVKDSLNYKFEITAPQNIELVYNGTKIAGKQEGTLNRYMIDVDLTEEDVKFELLVLGNGKKYSVSLPVSKVEALDNTELLDLFSVKETASVEIGDITYKEAKISANGKEYVQGDIDVSSINIDNKYKEVLLDFYYDGEKPVELILKTKSKTGAFSDYKTVTVQQGWNSILIDLAICGISKGGELDQIRMRFEPISVEVFDTDLKLVLKDLILYR